MCVSEDEEKTSSCSMKYGVKWPSRESPCTLKKLAVQGVALYIKKVNNEVAKWMSNDRDI